MRPLLALICLLALCGVAASAAPVVQAQRCPSRAPAIDGEVLGDAAWATAPVAGGFGLLGKADVAPTQATGARVVFDDRNVYVAFVCREDEMAKIATKVTAASGRVWEDDCVELFLAPLADRGRYYHFVVNAAGVLRCERGHEEHAVRGARAAARKAGGYWSAELAVPFSGLGLDETVADTWGVNFCRNETPHGEVTCWAPCKGGFHDPESFGDLKGLTVDFTPLVVAGLRARAEAALEQVNAVDRMAQEYQDLEPGIIVLGACARNRSKLATLQAALGRHLNMTRERELGAQMTQIEAALPSLQAQALKLPLVRAVGPTGYAVCSESTMVKVRPDKAYQGPPARRVRLALARNEYQATQLVVVPLREGLRAVAVSVSPLKGPRRTEIAAANVRVNVVGYVNVKQSSGGATLAPGLLPDPLLDNGPTDIERSRVQSWWVTVYAPRDQLPGVYQGELVVAPRNAPQTRVPFEVRVWGYALPTTSRLRSSYGINLGSIFSKYDLSPGPGIPSDWNAGAWVGNDVTGMPNYFGSMKYDLAFDYDIKQDGKRSCRVHVTEVTPGTRESPRFCYYVQLTDLKPKADYELSVWYRTAPGDKAGAYVWDTSGGSVALPATGGEWRRGTYTVNVGDHRDLYLYLRVDQVGTVWFDDVCFAPKGQGHLGNLLPNHSFERGDETGRDRIRDAYYFDALRHRASPTNVIAPKITTAADGKVALDWGEFDRKMQEYLDAGLSAFNVSWCELPSGWGSVEKVEDQRRIERARLLLQQTQAHLEEKGWTQLAYIYTIDEPGWQAFSQVKQAFELAHSAAPKLKRLLTYGYGASKPIEPGAPRYADLAGYVDIHVPHSDCYEPVYLSKRQAAGDEVWAYVCISAQRPYLNVWGIDYPGMDHRLLFWQLFDHNITGFLYWETAYWQKDPWQDTLSYPGGNGDGSLIYYGKAGPVDSIRWELVQEGTEDYDMLVMLREASAALRARNPRAKPEPLLSFPQLTKSWTEYSQDPKALEDLRVRIGNRLEELTRMLGK